jgi:hypothetical protein
MYFIRARAAAYLTQLGIPSTAQGLADMASDGRGPTYGLLNGRAVYTVENLNTWVSSELARPVVRYRERRTAA